MFIDGLPKNSNRNFRLHLIRSVIMRQRRRNDFSFYLNFIGIRVHRAGVHIFTIVKIIFCLCVFGVLAGITH